MMEFMLRSPADVVAGIAARMKRRRIDENLTQRELAALSGVPYGTLRLLEETGKGSLETVVKIAFALGAEREFDAIFPPKAPQSIEDVIGGPVRRRARRAPRRGGGKE